jgi:hypothetical protein
MNNNTISKKTISKLLYCLFLLPVAIAAYAQEEFPRYSVGSVFNLTAELSNKPATMKRFTTLEPFIKNRDEVAKLAKAFHLDAPVEKREKRFMVRQGNRTLEVFHQNGTGSIRYSDNDALDAETAAAQLPRADEAIKKAGAVLSQNGLMPEGIKLLGTRPYEFQQLDEKGQVLDSGNSAIAVVYGFEIDNTFVKGPGAKAGVVFGEEGKIIGCSLIWRPIKQEGEFSIISPMAAFEKFKRIWPPEKEAKTDIQTHIYIDEVSTSYYAKPGIYAQKTLDPVYQFRGYYELKGKTNRGEVDEKEYFEVLVPALERGDAQPISTWGPSRAFK